MRLTARSSRNTENGRIVTTSDQLLDRYLSRWQFHEVHSRRIGASREEVRESLLAFTLRDAPLSRFVLSVRLAPAAIAARRWPFQLDRPWFELFLEFGLVELGRSDDEFVFGAIGNLWRFRVQLEPISGPDAFQDFEIPGFAKGAMNFHIDGVDGSVTLTTETRVWATDQRALRSFRPYWVPSRAFGGLIRREWLGAIAKRAEGRPNIRPSAEE
jgi:hypothetical protein